MNCSRTPTLAEVLAARDNRAARHSALARKNTGGQTLLSLSLVIPGEVKRSLRSLASGNASVQAIIALFGDNIEDIEFFDLPTGFEADFIIRLPEAEVKRLAVQIEESHPLGRLFDLDIIGKDGVPLSRSALGIPERKCLLCDLPARHCMRAGNHSRSEVSDHVAWLIDRYLSTLCPKTR